MSATLIDQPEQTTFLQYTGKIINRKYNWKELQNTFYKRYKTVQCETVKKGTKGS